MNDLHLVRYLGRARIDRDQRTRRHAIAREQLHQIAGGEIVGDHIARQQGGTEPGNRRLAQGERSSWR